MTTVTLSWEELALAAHVGIVRNIEALKRGRPEPYGWTAGRSKWDSDIESSAAEMAFAKVLGRYWLPLHDRPAELEGDVGDVQVRSTNRSNGCLLLHERDKDDAAFVLMVGTAPTFKAAGWLRGRDGKRREWWRTDTGRPAFFVPQSALKEMPRRD